MITELAPKRLITSPLARPTAAPSRKGRLKESSSSGLPSCTVMEMLVWDRSAWV